MVVLLSVGGSTRLLTSAHCSFSLRFLLLSLLQVDPWPPPSCSASSSSCSHPTLLPLFVGLRWTVPKAKFLRICSGRLCRCCHRLRKRPGLPSHLRQPTSASTLRPTMRALPDTVFTKRSRRGRGPIIMTVPNRGESIAFAGAAYTYTIVVMESKSQKAYGEVGTIAGKNFSQICIVFAFGGENRAESSFTQSLTKSNRNGGVLIRRGDVDGGKAIEAVCAAIVGGIGLGQGMSYVPTFSKGRASIQAILGTINRPPSVYHLSGHNGVELAGVKGDIELCNVDFSYPSRPAIRIFDNFSLKIFPGHSIALVGESGSSKSTVISLIADFKFSEIQPI